MEKKVKIIFTSDLHGVFYPTSYATGRRQEMGLMRCASQFEKDGNTLIIDGGDILQGSPFTAYCHDVLKSTAPLARIMNLCGYDFVTVGNHDFNFGMSYLKSYLEELTAACVCENLVDAHGSPLYPYVIKTMENSLKIGIMGIVTDYVNVWEKPGHLEGSRVTDPFAAAKNVLEKLKPQVDLTVCVYHGGFEKDVVTGERLSATTENIAYRLCEELDFDLLLTGHQHMTVPGQEVLGTFVVQPAEYGREFHEITVTVGKEKHITSRLIPAVGCCPEAMVQALAPVEEGLQEWLDEDVGILEHAMRPKSHLEMAVHGSEIANLFNLVQMDFTGAMLSAASLANEISGLPEAVRRRDILMTYPYQNTLTVLEITGAQLKRAIERSAQYFALDKNGQVVIAETFLKPKVEHYNYDYFAGAEYVIDVSRPVGSRVVSLRYQQAEIQDEEVFSICVCDYRASGAGGYPMYTKCKVLRAYDTEMADVLMKYFETHTRLPALDKPNFRVTFSHAHEITDSV